MTRETVQSHQIALLATGDEISNGDILNTNSQEIARKLFDHGMHIGMHMVTPDIIADMERAIDFLLITHDALIITGGLGPTSDDLTRFALAHATQIPLVFHEESWQIIVERLHRFGYHTPPESNRQQALFPENATVIPNPNGTAAGCIMHHQQKLIFMLPGPPQECLPMLHEAVLPELKKAGFQKIDFHKNWLLFGVSEGHIAEILDQLAKPFACTTGYRLFYPYLEFKLHATDANDFNQLVPQIEQAIAPFLIGDGQHMASELLREKIAARPDVILQICDQATGGLLESVLKTPKTAAHLLFTSEETPTTQISIQGLDEYWQAASVTQTNLHIKNSMTQKELSVEIPFRGSRVKQYAVEFICWQLLQSLGVC